MPESVGLGLSAGWDREELDRPPELAAAKKTSKTGLASLKPAGSLLIFFNVF